MRRVSLFALFCFALPVAAQEFKMEPPKSPADSLKCIKLRPGFKAELMVAEPLVMSPIAFAWGADGKFWVVEMGDYPLGIDGKGKPGGKIKYLEKSRPDGPYDKMTLFMEGLGFPTGVFPYDKGILVTCAPDIFYVEVLKNSKAGKKQVLFTGFKEGNQQHRVNGLTWGLDNWIYGANGDSGGVIKSIKTGDTVDIRGRDFRFKVESGQFEAVSGQSQFGRCRDDWGNWFGNNNSNPMYHYVLEDRYLKRNPHVLYPDPKVTVPIIPGAQPVYPISKPLERFNSPQALNHFTSACSTIIYRDNLFGKDFEGNMFVSEPVHNLVHREIMKPKGVTFTSQRADDEQKSEFLASSDNWFRPTMIQVGPDGALWIADMYRYVIEHPEWIPKDWQKKLDLRAGDKLGRIYRVYPEKATPRAIPKLDKMKAEELVKQLESPSGWVRDTAQQRLYEWRGELVTREAMQPLETLIKKGKTPQARLCALHALDAIPGAALPALAEIVVDPHPAVRKQGIALYETNLHGEEKVLRPILKDQDEQVRQQLAYSLGRPAKPRDIEVLLINNSALVQLLCRDAEDPYILAAGLSSVSAGNWNNVNALLTKEKSVPSPLFAPMMRLAKAFGKPLDSSQLFLRQLTTQQKMPQKLQFTSVGEMLDALEKNDMPVKKIMEVIPESERGKAMEKLLFIYLDAVKILEDAKSPTKDKLDALRLLARGLGNDGADYKTLSAYLTPKYAQEVQSAVVAQVGRNFDPRVPTILLEPWKGYSPALRGQVLDALLSRPIWTSMTLDAIKRKQVLAHEIDAVRRQRFLQQKDKLIRQTAEKIFAAASNPDRGKVVDIYWLQMPKDSDKARGAKLFAKSCAACHKFGEVGHSVGPDLASVGDKSVQGLLTAILDPNRAVEPRYINYLAVTKAGKTYTGILSSETSTSITLLSNDGKAQQLLRNELEELSSTGKSMMPEGLEKDLTAQDIADIIQHLRFGLSIKAKESR